MRLKRLLDTSTFRLALIYLILFGVSAFVLLIFLYFTTAGVLERQTNETIQAEITGLEEQYRTEGLRRLRQVIERRSAAQPHRASIYLLTDPIGQPIAGNLPEWPAAESGDDGWISFTIDVTREDEGVERRRARAATFILLGGFRLLVGRDVEDRLQIQTLIMRALWWGLALTLLLGLAGGFLVSRGMVGRVDAINRTTRRIMAGDLSQRIALTGSRDEFDQLAGNLNAMLDQIERLLAGMRQVTDNVAHDLRTPLNRLRSRIEVALLKEPGRAETRELLEATLADAETMIGTFNALLEIARAEAGSERTGFETVDLEALGRDLADLYRPLAEDKTLAFDFRCARGLRMRANRHLLAQALANLLDNAIKYTPAGGRVGLALEHGTTGPAIIIADTGPGIPEAERERVL
ncbi:MAG TPA: HAMP domain-containing protein, partial [Geminicoccaceae bacterium]|nr:HAMP domain-containing protein [Geminicoccaceae bacterium]